MRFPPLPFAACACAILLVFPPAFAAEGFRGCVARKTLANGLEVVAIRDPLAPVAETMMTYRTGSRQAPKGFSGTAHALEHMMFNGTHKIQGNQLVVISARMGNRNNAQTTSDITQYYFEVPAGRLNLVLRLEADRMRGLKITSKKWKRERGAIEQEVSRDLSSPIYRFESQIRKILFRGTPYETDALGSRESFDATDTALLSRFYRQWYAPNNALLVIAGDIDPQKAIQEAERWFGKIRPVPLPALPAVIPGPLPAARHFSLPTDLPVALATMSWRMPGYRNPDYAAAVIAADVLGSERGNLFGLVAAGQALEASFSYQPEIAGGMGLAYLAYPKSLPAPLYLKKLQAVLEGYYRTGLPEDLIEAAKKKEIASLAFDANSIPGLAESWSDALALEGLSSPDQSVRRFEAVSKKEVDAVLRKWLAPGKSVLATLLPDDRNRPLAAKGFGGMENFSSTPKPGVHLPKWAEKALGQVSLPPPFTLPARYVLDNGLELLVQREQVSPTIELFGHIRHNPALQEPKGREGVGDLTSALFLYGSQKHDRLQLAAALDDLAANETAGESFSLNVLSRDFQKGLALLGEHELHPRFPLAGFRAIQRQQALAQAGELASPGYKFSRAIQRALVPASDPTLREATPASIRSLTLRDVRHYYQTTYRPDITTIYVIGDIDPQAAYQAIVHVFGKWRKNGATPQIDLRPAPDSRKSMARIADPGRSQDHVKLAENLQIRIDNPDRHALALGNEILGTGFSSRLMQDLRVKTGYVYGVESGIGYSRTRSAFEVDFGADPDKVRPARELAVKNIRALSATPVSQKELDMAKASLLGNNVLTRGSFGGLAASWLRIRSLGLPLSAPNDAARALEGLSAEQVRDAFRKWIRPEDLAEIILGPAPEKRLEKRPSDL